VYLDDYPCIGAAVHKVLCSPDRNLCLISSMSDSRTDLVHASRCPELTLTELSSLYAMTNHRVGLVNQMLLSELCILSYTSRQLSQSYATPSTRLCQA
jgi:hypothetical protein